MSGDVTHSTEVIPLDEKSGTGWINATGIPNEEIMPGLLKSLSRWTDGMSNGHNVTRLSLFDRKAYSNPGGPYAKFCVARAAVANDDVVSGVLEVTTGLTFQGIKWESGDPDVADVFNQMARDLNLDALVRQWYREDFTYSQVVIGMWWGNKEYKVRGVNVIPEQPHQIPNQETGIPDFQPKKDPKTGKKVKPKKVKRKKTFNIYCPIGITMLDPMKVVPLSPTLFGRDRLAWQSNAQEMLEVEKSHQARRNGEVYDEVLERFFLGPYVPENRKEREYLENMGADVRYLLLLNPDNVFRIAPNRIPYERFSDLRLNSVFPLLDLKQQLIEADRVALIGQANYILLVRVGEKDHPAQEGELSAVRQGVMSLARVPLIVGDHRLQIDILTPDQNFALDPSRYDTLDKRILARCLGSINMGGSNEASVDSMTSGVARVLEARRHMMKRAFEEFFARAVVEHPKNGSQFGDEEPNLAFTPRNVRLDSDTHVIQAVMALRTAKEISRETILEYFGFDQTVEAQRREYEDESGLDEIFGTVVPFSSPGQGGESGTPAQSGATGGRPLGGGKTAQSPQAQTQPKTKTGNKTKASLDEES